MMITPSQSPMWKVINHESHAMDTSVPGSSNRHRLGVNLVVERVGDDEGWWTGRVYLFFFIFLRDGQTHGIVLVVIFYICLLGEDDMELYHLEINTCQNDPEHRETYMRYQRANKSGGRSHVPHGDTEVWGLK